MAPIWLFGILNKPINFSFSQKKLSKFFWNFSYFTLILVILLWTERIDLQVHTERCFINPIIKNFEWYLFQNLLQKIISGSIFYVVRPLVALERTKIEGLWPSSDINFGKINQYFYNPGNWVTNNNGSKTVNFA